MRNYIMQQDKDVSFEIILKDDECQGIKAEMKNQKLWIKKLFKRGMDLMKKDEVLQGSVQIYELAKRKLISWKSYLRQLLREKKEWRVGEMLEKKRKALNNYEMSGVHPDIIIKKGYWVVFLEYRWGCRKCDRLFADNKKAQRHMKDSCFKGEASQKSEQKQVIMKKIFKRA